MVQLKFSGEEPRSVLNILFRPGETRPVTEEAAWTILDVYGKEGPFTVVKGKPRQPTPPPARLVGRSVMDEQIRVPDASAMPTLPPAIPDAVRKDLTGAGWKDRVPQVCKDHHAGALVLWCALSGLTDQAEEIMRHVLVPE